MFSLGIARIWQCQFSHWELFLARERCLTQGHPVTGHTRIQKPRYFTQTQDNSAGPCGLQSSPWDQLKPCSSGTIAQILTLPNPVSFPSPTGVHTKSILGNLACNKRLPWSRGSEASESRRSRRVGWYLPTWKSRHPGHRENQRE